MSKVELESSTECSLLCSRLISAFFRAGADLRPTECGLEGKQRHAEGQPC